MAIELVKVEPIRKVPFVGFVDYEDGTGEFVAGDRPDMLSSVFSQEMCELGGRLRKARMEADVRMSEACAQFGWTYAQISNLECGLHFAFADEADLQTVLDWYAARKAFKEAS